MKRPRTVSRVRISDRFAAAQKGEEALESGGLKPLSRYGDRGFESHPLQRRVYAAQEGLRIGAGKGIRNADRGTESSE
jgi:hypothetical protein